MSSKTYAADEYAEIAARMRELKGEVVAVAVEDTAEDDYCDACDNGGWVMSSYQAAHPPNLEECPRCCNPLNLPCP